MGKKNALGRGLSALIETEHVTTSGSLSMSEIEMDKIEANPNQPRISFDQEALAELAASIKNLGIIQPITLRKINENKYQIISGERRFKASKLIGLKTIPAYIKTVEDDASLEMMALIENIQREDLNAIEISLSFQKLIDEFKLTQDQLSDKVGKKRATISNYLRLLKLPAVVQIALKEKKIDMGHARALIGIENPEQQLHVYEQIVKDGLSVRKVEELVRKVNQNQDEDLLKETKANNKNNNQEFEMLTNRLSKFFNTNVSFVANEKGKGKISISFSNEEQLEKIIEVFDHLTK